MIRHSSQSPQPTAYWLLKCSELTYWPLKFKNIGYCLDNLVPYSFDMSCLQPSTLKDNTIVVPRLLLTNYEQLLPWQSDPKTESEFQLLLQEQLFLVPKNYTVKNSQHTSC